jgi:hypothetical protein
MIGLVQALARLLPSSGEDPLVRIGRLNARMHLQGTYAHLLKDASPSALPVRVVALWKTMHDTGDFQLSVGESSADARLSGYGHPTAEMCAMLRGYLVELFVQAGASDVEADETDCCRHGGGACRWRIGWTRGEGPGRD